MLRICCILGYWFINENDVYKFLTHVYINDRQQNALLNWAKNVKDFFLVFFIFCSWDKSLSLIALAHSPLKTMYLPVCLA